MNFLVMVTKDTAEKSLRDGMLSLSHGIAGFSQWFLGPIYLGRTLCHWEHLTVIIFCSW